MPTPYMNLTIPTVSVTAGPLYATEINTAFSQVDSHNHTVGFGAQIPTGGISVNADFPFNGYNSTLLRSSQYTTQASPLSLGTDLACSYSAGANGDLYWNDGLGNQVRITASGAVNVAASGNITGMGATTATATYSAISTAFTWLSNTGIPAIMNVGPVAISPIASNSFALTLQAPTLSASTSYTLPAAAPASTKIVTMNSSGVLGVAYDVDNSTIQVSSNTLQVPTGGITATQIAANTITGSKLANGTITATQIASGTITTTQIASTTIVAGNIANNTITRNQLAAVGAQYSSVCVSFTPNGSLTQITNMTVTLTTTGRPVIIGMQPSGSAGGTLALTASGALGQLAITLKKAGSSFLTTQMQTSSGTTVSYPPNMIWFDNAVVGSPGTYTYTLFAQVIGGSASALITDVVMFAYEL